MEVICLAGLLVGCTVGFYSVSSSNSISSQVKGKILIGLGCIIGALGLITEIYRSNNNNNNNISFSRYPTSNNRHSSLLSSEYDCQIKDEYYLKKLDQTHLELLNIILGESQESGKVQQNNQLSPYDQILSLMKLNEKSNITADNSNSTTESYSNHFRQVFSLVYGESKSGLSYAASNLAINLIRSGGKVIFVRLTNSAIDSQSILATCQQLNKDGYAGLVILDNIQNLGVGQLSQLLEQLTLHTLSHIILLTTSPNALILGNHNELISIHMETQRFQVLNDNQLLSSYLGTKDFLQQSCDITWTFQEISLFQKYKISLKDFCERRIKEISQELQIQPAVHLLKLQQKQQLKQCKNDDLSEDCLNIPISFNVLSSLVEISENERRKNYFVENGKIKFRTLSLYSAARKINETILIDEAAAASIKK